MMLTVYLYIYNVYFDNLKMHVMPSCLIDMCLIKHDFTALHSSILSSQHVFNNVLLYVTRTIVYQKKSTSSPC